MTHRCKLIETFADISTSKKFAQYCVRKNTNGFELELHSVC